MEHIRSSVQPQSGRGLTRGLGLDPQLETRFVNRKPHEHILRAEPPDVPRTRSAEDMKKVDDPITSPCTFTICHAGHLLDGRFRGQGGALGRGNIQSFEEDLSCDVLMANYHQRVTRFAEKRVPRYR